MSKQNRAQSSETMMCKNAIHAGYSFSIEERKEEQKRMQKDARKRLLYETMTRGDENVGRGWTNS